MFIFSLSFFPCSELAWRREPWVRGEVCKLSLELRNGIAALQGDLAALGEFVFEERQLVCQGGNLEFLGHSGLCRCEL
jgi:hypothetical protein